MDKLLLILILIVAVLVNMCSEPSPPNRAPIFKEMPTLHVKQGNMIRLDLTKYCHDPDGDKLAFFYKGKTINKGLFELDSGILPAGNYEYVISVSDGEYTVKKILRIEVYIPNRAPVFKEIPTLHIKQGDIIRLDLTMYCYDPDGDELTFFNEGSPINRGFFELDQGILPVGNYEYAISVSDGEYTITKILKVEVHEKVILITHSGNGIFHFIDASFSKNPEYIKSQNLGMNVISAEMLDNETIVVGTKKQGIHFFKISSSYSLKEIDHIPFDYPCLDLKPYQGKLLVANGSKGMTVIDLTSKSILKRISDVAYCRKIETSGNFAYLACSKNGLATLDLSNYSVVENYDLDGYVLSTVIKEGYLFAVNYPYGLDIFRISSGNFSLYKKISLNNLIAVNLKGNLLIASTEDGKAYLYDVTNPGHVFQKCVYNSSGESVSVDLYKNLLLISDGWNGLVIYDLNNPSEEISSIDNISSYITFVHLPYKGMR